MDDLQFLKDEISSNKFNKRIFYAKNALRYTEIMTINFFVDNYIPYITNYIIKEENVEEVLTEYSNTLTFFLKFLGKEENFKKYKERGQKEDIDEINYKNAINSILKCFFEKILLNVDEILRETTINNIRELLLEIDDYPLLISEFENKLNNLKIFNIEANDNIDINEENEIKIFLFTLLYPFIKGDEKKIESFCNNFKSDIITNTNRKKKRLLIQNIINIIPFIRKSLDKIKALQEDNKDFDLNMIKINVYILKEILSSLITIMDDKNLIISVGMNYICEIILAYTIENITEIILFYEEYIKYLSNDEINLIVVNYFTKLENFINNETNLKVNLTWRVKVSYIENICKLKNFIISHNPKYFNDTFSQFCLNTLKGSKIEIDLKISILKNVEVLIPKISMFLPIFGEIINLERNKYILSSLGIALNKILNNKQLYEINNMEAIINILTPIFQLINSVLNNDNYEVIYSLSSSFEFSFFNYINSNKEKILVLNQALKLYIIVFQKINEWRVRFNLFEKFKKFLFEYFNILTIINLYQMGKNNREIGEIVFQLINNIRFLLHLFFLDKAITIRINGLELINNIMNFQIKSNINENIYLIRIKEELMKYQLSIFSKNSGYDENIINNLNLLNMNKSYSMKLFFLESVKKFIIFYSDPEKKIINEIVQLIKNDLKYSKENIANNKINREIEVITEILKANNNN